jgi:hypothetical protein
MSSAQIEAPLIHPDLAQPHVEQLSAKCPRLMYQAIKARSMATGMTTAFVIRELIRKGAPHMDPPMDVTGAGIQQQQVSA